MGGKLIDEKQLKKAFKKIKEERDEHLESINQLTSELQTAFEYISELEGKYDKLKEITDEFQIFKNSQMISDKSHFSSIELSLEEQMLFLTLYVFGEREPLSIKFLVEKLGLTESGIKSLLSSLLDKGIPITKEKVSSSWYFNLDPRFRDIQAKEKVIAIHDSVSKGIHERSLNAYFGG